MPPSDLVITGLGVVSPIGIGREEFWTALCERRQGVGRIRAFDPSSLPVQIAAEIDGFSAKQYVTNRKSLKLMCRDAELGVAAAALACQDAGIASDRSVDPQRLGVVLGADRICNAMDESQPAYRRCLVGGHFDFGRWASEGMAASYPLSFLKVLPNMIASHVSIAQDARGPNNTMHQNEVSGLMALGEAARVIERGAADAMIVGGASSQIHPFDCVRRCVMGILSPRQDDPATVMRPFDADRDGQVWGEGAAAFILEDRRHAEARGARVLARVLSWASTCEPPSRDGRPGATGLPQAVRLALGRAGLDAGRLGHVNAHGLSTVEDDRSEALALHQVVPDVPLTAPKSYFGNLGAAGGAVEMAVSVLSFAAGLVPPTLNYDRPDPRCPLQVICREPLGSSAPVALLVNWTSAGQAAAVAMAGGD